MVPRLRKLHTICCIVAWIAWIIGLALTATATYLQSDSYNTVFFSIVHPYNSIVLLCSLLPVEPVLCIAIVVYGVRAKTSPKNIIKPVALFFLTVMFWVAYVGLYIALTGGV